MRILLTGSAGFIGMHTAKKLLERGEEVVGVDNINDYYDVSLKLARLKELDQYPNFSFIKADLSSEKLSDIFIAHKPERVINLAAQAGVRYSLKNPMSYVKSNLEGFVNILEACRHNQVDHLVYASSSSVYGSNTSSPFSEADRTDHPVSLYGATKKSNELMAHSYSHLYKLPTTGLRFFTVYGPWGRPDMALFLFTKAILEDKEIDVFNHGNMIRDFTYIDDIVEGIVRVLDKRARPSTQYNSSEPLPNESSAPFKIFNIGNSQPAKLLTYINILEESLGKKANINFLPMQPGDVESTNSNTKSLEEWTDFRPNTTIEEGISNFVQWYKFFYKKN